MNKLKNISIVWGILAILLVTFLTTMGFIYKNKSQKYKEMENRLVEIAKTYTATDFKFPVNGEKIIINYEELKNAGLIDKLQIDDQKCKGYIVLSFKNVVEYKAYIKCDKYTTHGYDKNKLN